MTEEEIKALYSQIEGKSTYEIQLGLQRDNKRSCLQLQDNRRVEIERSCRSELEFIIHTSTLKELAQFDFNELIMRALRKKEESQTECFEMMQRPHPLLDLCEEAWNKHYPQIKSIIQAHPKTKDCVLDIVLSLVPQLAQQHIGFSAAILTSAVVVVCRRHLGL